MKGTFITFEGSEGSGKSTQIAFAMEYLKKKKLPVVFVREPGGVNVSEQIREILLDVKNKNMTKECETLLYMASRAQLVREVIAPALQKGRIVLCDRFLDSTVAYQGYGCGVDLNFIYSLGKFATKNLVPDLTFVFDIDAKAGLSRIKRAKDRIEQRELAYHNRVRRGYLALAREDKKRIRLIDSQQSKEAIQKQVQDFLNKLLGS